MARILIVDDDSDVLEAGRMVLSAAGHDVQTASNREAGMQALGAFKPDLLILDVMMDAPDDGIAMAQDLRREGCQTPILMLTSISRVSGLSFGRDDERNPVDLFVEKPIKPADLAEKVAGLLNAREVQGHVDD